MWRQICVTLVLLCVKDSRSQPSVCGVAPLNPRIVGGKDARHGSWPWMVSIHINKNHDCGGSLITNEWVLTAAHCVKGMQENTLLVYLGKSTQQGDNPNEITRTVKNIIAHSSFAYRTMDNDIALLHLSSPVDFNDYISPVCLAAKNSVFTFGTQGWITGWGDIGVEKPLPLPGTLQEAMIRTYENNECATRCTLKITSNMICAGLWEGGRDIGEMDSGGPMVHKQCSRWVQSGVVSWGDQCAQPDKPSVYTRVSEHQQWIEDNVGQNPPGFVLFDPKATCSDSPTG